MVDYSYAPEQQAFRNEVSAFIDRHVPSELVDEAPYVGIGVGAYNVGPLTAERRRELTNEWRAALFERGWVAPAWPTEYGGAGMTPMEQFILAEVIAEKGVTFPRPPDVGSTIMTFGTDEQKHEFLPPMLSGGVRWCQGYSEPGSGSDLASLQTRAARDGDDFVLNGQKIWTSGAKQADWMFALVRTDPDAPKHRGITYLLLPMTSPGLTVRPLAQINGASEFNEVFFEDVHVPVKNAVGEVNRGWYVGATHLDFERSSIGSAVSIIKTLDLLRELLVDPARADVGRLQREPAIRSDVAQRYVEAEVARQLSYRVISVQDRGGIPSNESSVSKLFTSELGQRIGNTGVKAIGLYGQLWDPEDSHAPNRARWPRGYVSAVAWTIGGGTSEIQRNIIATRSLGLPRG
ncbi:MAG: acyl-CoA dehydrogenase family protein [Chloroflexi bacterium]|nr:acyl-CoA dehydrogenase family protein [Chloroflexota bacterium]MDA1003431.1 acyl-CoA dehydrogenase family protein [Chloroflexota bacterium]